MPWTPDDAVTHNKKATGAKAKQWSAVANKVLEQSGDDGKAVRIANAAIQKNRVGRYRPGSK